MVDCKTYSRYDEALYKLRLVPKIWLITGVAGFIGSNLLESLLKLNQTVVGLDNFSTGFQRNLDEVKKSVSPDQWSRFKFILGDICKLEDCQLACTEVDYVLHQAALGSVPRSINDPIGTNTANISGFLNMLVASRDANVKSFTFAASSSTYGDHPALPKIEENIGKPLSPYAVTKYVNELYADVFGKCYGFNTIGLRYFNIFGARQNPNGAYAAVIPKWIFSLLNDKVVEINGDGETSRDFTHVENAIQANILAATTENPEARNQIYNVAVGERTTLRQLFDQIKLALVNEGVSQNIEPLYRDFRPGDVKHSLASTSKAHNLLGYNPVHTLAIGLKSSMQWYIQNRSFLS